MKSSAIAVLAALALATPALAQSCPERETPRYRGPLFDAMAQTDQTLDGAAALQEARAAGVTRIALFARVHNRKDGQSLVNSLAKANPDMVVVGAPKLFDLRGDLDSGYVDQVLRGVKAHAYGFVGEILYTHGDKSDGETTETGERYIDPNRPQSARLIAGLKGQGAPVMTHWEVYDWSRDWPNFDRFYGAHPDQVFVWPHVGFASPDQATQVLATHPNVWATLSKKDQAQDNLADPDKADDVGGPIIDSCNRLTPEWRAVMIRFSDRLMFATDAHKGSRWKRYGQIVRHWRVILGQLPPDVAEAIAHGNAERLYGPAPTAPR